jgi:thioredoxin reductase
VKDWPEVFDLAVVGGGNAALCAAIMAAEAGASVLISGKRAGALSGREFAPYPQLPLSASRALVGADRQL